MRVVLFICLTAAPVNLACIAPATAESVQVDAVTRARDELSQRLETAEAAGSVSLRGKGAPERQVKSPPPLRLADGANCLTFEKLAQSEVKLGTNKPASLDRLREVLLLNSAAGRAKAELELARAYLVIGFTAEARAIAVARDDEEAAGIAALAMLAEGDHQRAASMASRYRSCGPLHDFILEASAAFQLSPPKISEAANSALSRLPHPLRQPIAEALAVETLSSNPRAAQEFVAIARLADAPRKSKAGALIDAVITPDGVQTDKALALIAAVPGPLRENALHALGDRIKGDAPPDLEAALEADMAEVAGRSPLSPSLTKLNFALAERRLARRDIKGAARAYVSAFRNVAMRQETIERYRAAIRPLLETGDAEDRLLALDALAEAPELAAAALEERNLHQAATSFAELGALKTLSRFLLVAELDDAEEIALSAKATLRTGRASEYRAIEEKVARGGTEASMFGEAALANDGNETGQAPEKAAESDSAALTSRSMKPPSDPKSARKALFAYRTLRHAPPPALLAATGDERGAAALFLRTPDPLKSAPREIKAFAAEQRLAISFLRKAANDE